MSHAKMVAARKARRAAVISRRRAHRASLRAAADKAKTYVRISRWMKGLLDNPAFMVNFASALSPVIHSIVDAARRREERIVFDTFKAGARQAGIKTETSTLKYGREVKWIAIDEVEENWTHDEQL